MSILWFVPAFIFIYMSAWFILSLRVKRQDVVDIAWGGGFLFLIWVAAIFRELAPDTRFYILFFAISLWGLRLSIHTVRRNLSKKDDWRYHRWHENEKKRGAWYSFFQVFLFQGAMMMIIALPAVYSVSITALPIFSINYLGIVMLVLGLLLESVADQQRYNFLKKKENKDKLITTGLWRYSRHPNYFGELLFWWGVYFLILGAPKAWMLVFSPLIVTYVLLFVSGLPMEERYRGRPDFEEYKRRTSALIPWFPKNPRS